MKERVKAKFKFKVHKDTKANLTWTEAVEYCESLGKGWRLPTRVEQLLMDENREEIGGFAKAYYWSSTEINNSVAWLHNFNIGVQFGFNKSNTYYVRAVRDIS